MKKLNYMILMALVLIMSGCSTSKSAPSTNESQVSDRDERQEQSNEDIPTQLELRFGAEGEPFTMKLLDNDTAAAIGGYVGAQDWNLPIYHFDDFENYEVMQYYDIPSRYEIPSQAERVTSQKKGDVYYSQPNRIVLFYQDAQVSGEFTKIGEIEDTTNLKEAVENNPVQEGWGNKIISITPLP